MNKQPGPLIVNSRVDGIKGTCRVAAFSRYHHHTSCQFCDTSCNTLLSKSDQTHQVLESKFPPVFKRLAVCVTSPGTRGVTQAYTETGLLDDSLRVYFAKENGEIIS